MRKRERRIHRAFGASHRSVSCFFRNLRESDARVLNCGSSIMRAEPVRKFEWMPYGEVRLWSESTVPSNP